ncbi:MAG: flagellar hook-associated protein FlgK [Dermatophilus congolensis]|nr:flagellar hook-associated protein FlgK [Dermatophilus congolensis]
MASFGGSLNIGTSAIHAAQRGLDITGQNIANSATEGYTRQRVELESIGGPGIPAFWSRYDGVGEGVKITGIKRMNDEFLEARSRNSNAALGNVEEQAKTMAAIERTFGEPSTTGLQSKLADFWNAWGKVANDPKGEAPKALVYERAGEVANHLNMMANAVHTQWEDASAEMSANVTDINVMAADVARLNEAIRQNNIAKVPANELLDQRDLLIKRISTLTGATVKPASLDQNADFNSQAVDVFIGGNKLVDGVSYSKLEMTPPYDPTYSYPTNGTQPPAVSVTWGARFATDGHMISAAPTVPVDSTDPTGPQKAVETAIISGRIAGQMDGMNVTIPSYLQQLDNVAKQFADTVNTQQTKGYSFDMVDGAPTNAQKGVALFASYTNGVSGDPVMNAANIQLARNTDASSLATSRGNPTGTWTDANGDEQPKSLDGDNALDMSKHLSDVAGADAQYRSLVVKLGTETQSVNRNVEVQRNVVKQAEDARDNVAGVSLNEEMTNLIRFQHSFSAAAKFIGVIDQTMETLINMTR